MTKYPRTYHIPWSQGRSSDDKVLRSTSGICSRGPVLVTEKMDGENTTLSREKCFARSMNSGYHESRTWVRALWGAIRHEIPDGMRICGENVFARHTIRYSNLHAYFLVFSAWVGDVCIPWDETLEWAALLGMHTVPMVYRGSWDGTEAPTAQWAKDQSEGWVARPLGSFTHEDFSTCVGKWVRKDHVVGGHWRNRSIEQNELATGVGVGDAPGDVRQLT